MGDTPLLQLRGITKTFGSVEALTDVDFEVRSGEVMALVGDNGAGKSTLIKCIAGTHAHDSGQILFEGREVFSTASVGIALSSLGYENPEEMLRDADTAM